MVDELIPPGRLRTMQIIAGALPGGVILFWGVVMFLVYGQGGAAPAPPNVPIVSLMAGAFILMAGAASFIVPMVITQAGLKQLAARSGDSDIDGLLNLRQTAMIIGMALLEGPAFLGIIAFLIERQPLVQIVPGLALLGILARFPTANSVRNWMEMSGRRIQELRQDRSIT